MKKSAECKIAVLTISDTTTWIVRIDRRFVSFFFLADLCYLSRISVTCIVGGLPQCWVSKPRFTEFLSSLKAAKRKTGVKSFSKKADL